MAGWNGSDRRGVSPPIKPKEAKKKPSTWSGLIAGGLVCGLAIGTYFVFFSNNESTRGERESDSAKAIGDATKPNAPKDKKSAPRRRREQIVSHKDFVATNTPVKTAEVKPPKILVADIFFECKDTTGRPLYKRPFFKHHAENFIYDVMTATPGERFIEVQLDSDFDDSFAESLKEPIVIKPDDSDEVKAAKELMIETKKRVEEYMRDGVLPSEVVTDARSELNKIADYRDLIQEELDKYKEKSDSLEDIKAFVSEANKLLDEYHAMPVSLSPSEIDEINERIAKGRTSDEEGYENQSESEE